MRLRFFVDHCVPAEVAAHLRPEHEAWTAYEANLADADDRDLIVYAEDRQAILVTTNRDCAHLARRLRLARCVYLAVVEAVAAETMQRASTWLAGNSLPAGMVLRVTRRSEPRILSPRPD